jgi:hypothetical protein
MLKKKKKKILNVPYVMAQPAFHFSILFLFLFCLFGSIEFLGARCNV